MSIQAPKGKQMTYYELKHYGNYQDLVGRKIPLDEIERQLSSFNLEAAILRLSQMNILLAIGRLRDKHEEIQALLRESFLDPETNRLIGEASEGKYYPIWFTRPLMLSMVRLCARACSEGEKGKRIDSPEERYEFGRCCLYLTDHLETEQETKSYTEGTEDEQRETWTPFIASTLDLSIPIDLMQAITRADIILSEVINSPNVKGKIDGFDLAKSFLEVVGLTHEQFRDFVFLIIGWFIGKDIDDFIKDPSKFIIHRKNFIEKTLIDDTVFEKLIECISVPVQTLSQYLNERPGEPLSRDFSLFSLCPLLALPDGFVACLDLDYLVGKLSAGIYEIVESLFPHQERTAGLRTLGYLFEEYVNHIFQTVYTPSESRLIVTPFEANLHYQGEKHLEPFDAVFIAPTNPKQAMVFQVKSQYLKSRYKYAENSGSFWREIDGKFGGGEQGGVTQLVDNIEHIWHQNESAQKKLATLNPSSIERVTPILVVQESFFRFPFFNWQLNRRFQSLLEKASISPRIAVDPLVVVDIDSLERLTPYLQKRLCSFEQPVNSLIFDDRNKECLRPFHDHITGFLSQFQEVKVRNEEAIARFGRITERMRTIFKDLYARFKSAYSLVGFF